ncbi:MAG TPA: FAD-dependent oxidoreductase, partial [Fusibacter sp.]|nr:FAD-dependent oxidoreductase [Fusibacter sp.]
MGEVKKYDAIIIGSGQAGNPLMTDLAGRGQKVAMIEKNEVGGSCINYGCTPTKTLIASSNLHHRVKSSEALGVFTENVKLDFKKVMKRKNDIVKDFRSSIEKGIEQNENVDLYRGIGSFLDNHTILVKLNDGGEKRLTAVNIFINSGAKPDIPPLEGLENVAYYDSTSIMDLPELPEHLIILGTGYIALEFGQLFKRFGSKVTLIGRGDTIIKNEDVDVSKRVQEILEADGIEFLLSTETKRVESSNGKVMIHYEKENKKDQIEGTHFMIATGRV